MNFVELLRSSLKEVKLDEVVTIRPQTCESFNTLMHVYRQDLTLTQSLEDCIAVSMAVHISSVLDGEPLWLYVVGSPSSGKSTLCELLGSDETHSRALSKFTGLVSGCRQGTHLIPMLQGKCVIVKDGTLLLESNPQQLSNVYGELRDLYDGSLNAEYRNGVSASFSNISFSMLIGITERIYSLNMAALGERFLHCKLETTRETETERNHKAIQSVFSATSRTVLEGNEAGDSRSFPKQRAYTAGFLSYLHMKIRSDEVLRPGYTRADADLIQALADMIACSRAQAPRVREYGSPSELLYDARPEASTRVVKQLSRLALCLCYVFGVKEITPTICRLLTKVALDTAYSRQHTIIRTVALSHGLTRTAISSLTNIPLESISRRIDDLISLGIFLPDSQSNRPQRGRSVPTLKCAPWIEDAFRRVERYVSVPDSQDTKPKPKRPPMRKGVHPKA